VLPYCYNSRIAYGCGCGCGCGFGCGWAVAVAVVAAVAVAVTAAVVGRGWRLCIDWKANTNGK
jgi:hypothetical protein